MSPTQIAVIKKPPMADAVAAIGVVRDEVKPNNKGKKNVAPTRATAYETIARINAGVFRANSSAMIPIPMIVNRDTRK